MKVIIVGPPGSGKTTLMHKIIRMNERNHFDMIVDNIEALFAGGLTPVNFPNLPRMILTAQNIDTVPPHVSQNALVLRTPDIRI